MQGNDFVVSETAVQVDFKKLGYNFSKHRTYVVADRTDASFVVQDIKYALPAKVRHKSIKFNIKLN